MGTIPIWFSVNYLGDPDNTVIVQDIWEPFLMAGGFLSVGACVSAMTNNQVIAFTISFVVCFAFNLSGFPVVLDLFSSWTPQVILEVISSFSFLSHFESIKKG